MFHEIGKKLANPSTSITKMGNSSDVADLKHILSDSAVFFFCLFCFAQASV